MASCKDKSNTRIKTKIKSKKLKRNSKRFLKLIQSYQTKRKENNMTSKGKTDSTWEMEQEQTSVDSEDMIWIWTSPMTFSEISLGESIEISNKGILSKVCLMTMMISSEVLEKAISEETHILHPSRQAAWAVVVLLHLLKRAQW